MRKITVFDFCSQIGAASDEIPVVVKAGMQEIGHFRSLYKIPAQAMPGVLEAKNHLCYHGPRRNHHPSQVERLQRQVVMT